MSKIKAAQRIATKVMPSILSGQRTLSTSAKAQQGVHFLEMDVQAMGKHCPLRATVDGLTIGFEHNPGTNIQPDSHDTEIKPFDHVPGPKGFPIVGTLFDYFKKDGLRFSKMFEAYRQRSLQYGPLYKEQIGPIQTVVVSDPTEYSKVLRAEGRHPVRREMEPMVYYRQQKGIDLGLVNSQGEGWHRQRTAVSKHMLKLKAVNQFSQPMNTVAQDFVAHLNEITDSNNEVPGLETEIFKWAMESIGTFLFEERIGCLAKNPSGLAQNFIYHLQSYFRLMQPLMYNLPIYKIFRTQRWAQYEHHADQVMRIGRIFVDKKVQALQEGDPSNPPSAFLSELLANENLSAADVTGTAVDLLMAAVETTSNALLWCLYCLAKNPEVQERLRREVNDVLVPEGTITSETLADLPYVKAVLKETFRMYPITYATSRILPADLELAGYNIPAGSHVQANLYGMFRDPELFPDPHQFRPERWLRGNMDPKLKSLSNLIWGHGPRMCIGRRFAEMELHLLLSKIVQTFKLSYTHEDVEPTLNTVMTPDRPLRITFTTESGQFSC
ncbi:hypothetical protein BaRGS_00020247 [Batillaria attramentaria]|uniref:Cytochrome P450 n=1 Tax=Batillaria attramentaria TaxID=370345 RepID=A0ABD0KMR2_9CAEN